jgi:hypothetical protein
MEMGAFPPPLDSIFGHYGLGWVIGDFAGQRIVLHDGGTFGFAALAAFLPDADLGLVALTNQADTGAILTYTALFRLLEIVFDTPVGVESLIDVVALAGAESQQRWLAQIGEVDYEAVSPYLGRYANPDLGSLTLAWRGGELIFDTGNVRTAIQPIMTADGAVSHYVPVDPPWAGVGATLAINLVQSAENQPTVRFTLLATPLEPETVYEYQPVVVFPAATPTP